jgi:hypothetical protein
MMMRRRKSPIIKYRYLPVDGGSRGLKKKNREREAVALLWTFTTVSGGIITYRADGCVFI